MSESITLTISIFRFRIVPTEIRTQILSEKKKTHLARSECCPPPPLAPSRRRFLLLFLGAAAAGLFGSSENRQVFKFARVPTPAETR